MDSIEVVFSFDTTGSMYPCLAQVRRDIEQTMCRLFRDISNIRIGIIAHGDYCDENSTYVMKRHTLSSDVDGLCRFVRNVEPTHGGDAPECYELVLYKARSMNWTSNKSKVLVLIGDDVPHSPKERQNYLELDWRNEIDLLLEMGVNVYAVQALNRRHATHFYEEIARKTGGCHLTLDQFRTITDLLMAICYKQDGLVHLSQFEREVASSGRMDRELDKSFGVLSGRASFGGSFKSDRYDVTELTLAAVAAGRFQVLDVIENQSIRNFVEDNGLIFQRGRGFYEFTKAETIQENKEVILMDKKTGDKFTGIAARKLINAPPGERVRIKPNSSILRDYIIFVQSTSYNRKLIAGTKFLYEVDLSR